MTEPWLLYSINKKLSTFCRLAQLLMTLGDLWGSSELLYRPSLYCGNSAWHTGQLLQNSWTDRVILEWRLPSTYLTQYYKASIIVLVSFLTDLFFYYQVSFVSRAVVHVSSTFVIFVAHAMFLTVTRLATLAHLLFTPDLTTAILYSQITALAQSTGTHWIQSYFHHI